MAGVKYVVSQDNICEVMKESCVKAIIKDGYGGAMVVLDPRCVTGKSHTVAMYGDYMVYVGNGKWSIIRNAKNTIEYGE